MDLMNAQMALGALLVFGLLVLIYGPWQWVWTDWHRMRLFEVRAKLFDLAAEGHISFDDPRYKHLRASLNAAIRFAHRATWPTSVMAIVGIKVFGLQKRSSELSSAFEALDDGPVKDKVGQLLVDAAKSMVITQLVRSPLLLVLGVVVLVVFACAASVRPLVRRARMILFEETQIAAEAAPTRRVGPRGPLPV